MGTSVSQLQSRWALTPRMTQALGRIAACRKLLEQHLSDAEPWHGAIRKQVMASVVHYSTKIEGNKLTREQVESVIAGETIEAPEKDKTEAINYLRAMQWAQTRAEDPTWRLSHESITTLHFLIGQHLGDDYAPLGKYREDQNQVSDRNAGQVIYWPPRPADVRELMDEFVEWSRSLSQTGMDPYIANALMHLIFVAIHPFSDGNGRVARVLCSLFMVREGYKAQAFYSLEEYFGVNWEAYGQSIEKSLGPRWNPAHADCSEWIEWYLDAVAEQVANAENVVRRTMAQVGVIAAAMSLERGRGAPPRSLLAAWLAVRDGRVTNRSYRSAIDVSAKTASDDLRRLTNAGYLNRVGERRGSRYVLGVRLSGLDIPTLVEQWMSEGPQAVVETITHKQQAETLFE